MPRRVDQATFLILDIGRNVSTPDEKGQKSFFSDAKECARKIIERKIMSQESNLLGIILLGSNKTKNNMAVQCEGAFRRVEILYELQNPTWEMILNLPDMPTKHKGDWMDSVIVAADYFKNILSDVKVSSHKIILMTNFKAATNLEESDIKQVINGFKEENYELDIIGYDIFDESSKENDIKLATKFIEITNGVSVTFEYAIRYLLFHKKKDVNPSAWNVDLSIGPNVKIPISSYIRLKDQAVVKKWVRAVKDSTSMRASTTESIEKSRVHVNTENQEVTNHDNIIKGYHYGQEVIPFDECDKSLLYESGVKSLFVYGFVHSSEINWQNLNGDGLSYVFGRKGDKKAEHAIRCLVECLHEMNLYAIARRVYYNGNQPKMFVLMPVIDNSNYICLSMAGLCYKDEIKYMAFPPTNLKKYACNDEQVKAFEALIDSMDLTKAYDETYDDTEAFPIAETCSPTVQYVLDSISFRAMNPEKPLPPPRDDIMMLFKVPPMIAKKSMEHLEKLKSLFTLTKIEKKPEDIITKISLDSEQEVDKKLDNLNSDIPKVQLPVKIQEVNVNKIGTINPVSDFKSLQASGKTLYDLSTEMVEVIENLIICNLDGTYTKALIAMKFFREECVKADPTPYNIWLEKFKKTLTSTNKDVLSFIKKERLDLILKDENESSMYDNTIGNESQLYENDTIPDDTALTMDTEMDNLFDEM